MNEWGSSAGLSPQRGGRFPRREVAAARAGGPASPGPLPSKLQVDLVRRPQRMAAARSPAALSVPKGSEERPKDPPDPCLAPHTRPSQGLSPARQVRSRTLGRTAGLECRPRAGAWRPHRGCPSARPQRTHCCGCETARPRAPGPGLKPDACPGRPPPSWDGAGGVGGWGRGQRPLPRAAAPPTGGCFSARGPWRPQSAHRRLDPARSSAPFLAGCLLPSGLPAGEQATRGPAARPVVTSRGRGLCHRQELSAAAP